jgi:hypothetical protein
VKSDIDFLDLQLITNKLPVQYSSLQCLQNVKKTGNPTTSLKFLEQVSVPINLFPSVICSCPCPFTCPLYFYVSFVLLSVLFPACTLSSVLMLCCTCPSTLFVSCFWPFYFFCVIEVVPWFEN